MKRALTVTLLCLSLVACASERARLRTAADAYATTLRVLADYRRAGRIDDEAAAGIEVLRIEARRALDAWRVAVEAGQPTDEPAAAFRHALDALTAAQLDAEEPVHEAD